jgi:hypothetical protein
MRPPMNDVIRALYVVRNPDKLRHWRRHPRRTRAVPDEQAGLDSICGNAPRELRVSVDKVANRRATPADARRLAVAAVRRL